MKTITVTDDRPLRDILKKGKHSDIVVERNGRAVALIVPFDDQDRQWYFRENDPAFIKSIARARKHVKQGKTITHENLKARFGIK